MAEKILPAVDAALPEDITLLIGTSVRIEPYRVTVVRRGGTAVVVTYFYHDVAGPVPGIGAIKIEGIPSGLRIIGSQ